MVEVLFNLLLCCESDIDQHVRQKALANNWIDTVITEPELL